MNLKNTLFIVFVIASFSSIGCAFGQDTAQAGSFNLEKDFLLVQFDCKTDVDDLHTVAAFATLLDAEAFSQIQYHAVAGTYGIQGGLYVPPNELFQLAFGNNWTDAHANRKEAVEKVKARVLATLNQGGDLWIADAGQSDFSAELIESLQGDLPELNTAQRIHVVQHAEWNEEVTAAEKLAFVKAHADYTKIPDGNGVGNGSPGFRSPDFTQWEKYITDPELKPIWQLAIDLAHRYNGQDDRYNNEAIQAGGLDFSDLSEVCWILGLNYLVDVEHYFRYITERE